MKKKLKFIFIGAFILAIPIYLFTRPNQATHTLHRLPISYSPAGVPLLEVSVEGRVFLVKMDLGSKFAFSVNKTLLDSFTKKHHGTVQWRDIQGKFYESPSFLIPKLDIGTIELTDVITSQENETYTINTTLWNDAKDTKSIGIPLGILGRPILEKTNWLLDFPQATVFKCDNKKALKKAGLVLENMTMVPIEMSSRGIILISETDAGALRLILDTGSTGSLVRASQFAHDENKQKNHGFSVATTSKFVLGGRDFGPKDLLLYDISSELIEVDGILGMDFLKNHVIYIDFSNKTMYISN